MKKARTSKQPGSKAKAPKQKRVNKSSASKAKSPAKKSPPPSKTLSAPAGPTYPPFVDWLPPAQLKLRSVTGRDGVLVSTLDNNNIHRLTEAEVREHFSFRIQGGAFVIPYYDLAGNPIIDEGATKQHKGRWYVRIRLDNPGKAKYLQESDTTTHPYIPRGLADLACRDLVLVEGELKALALVEEGIAALGLGGFYGWSKKIKGKTKEDDVSVFNPEIRALLDQLGVKRVLFLGDSDTSHNWQFADAAVKLAKAVHPLRVLLPRIPLEQPKGIDDVKAKLKKGFKTFWSEIVAKSVRVSPTAKTNALCLELLKDTPDYISKAPDDERRELFRRIANLSRFLRHSELPRLLKLTSRAKFDNAAVLDARAAAQEVYKDIRRHEALTPAQEAAYRRRVESIYSKEIVSASPAPKFEERQSLAAPEPVGAHAHMLLPSKHTHYDESARTIFERLAQTREYYLLAGKMVVLEPSPEDGLPAFILLSVDMLRARISSVGTLAIYRQWQGQLVVDKQVLPTKDQIATVMAAREVNLLPRITAIHNSPVLVDDGTKLCVLQKGYHAEAGGRYITEGEVELVKLEEAVDLIQSVFSEFLFFSEADRSRAIATLLTPAMHFGGLVPDWNTPIFIIAADHEQAGKGYMVELIQGIYNEKCSMVSKKERGGVGGMDESLAKALLSGRPFITIDNYRGLMDSQFLESVLTCPANSTVGCRIPFQDIVSVNPRPFIFQMTTNGFEPTRDIVARMCMTRIHKRFGYLFKDYPEGSLQAHVAANRKRILGAVFAVISHWHESGKPRIPDARGPGAFRKWWEIMNWILQNVFALPSPLDDHVAVAAPLSEGDRAWLEELGRTIEAKGQLNARLTTTAIAEICAERRITATTAMGTSEVDVKFAGRILARVFAGTDTRLVGAYRMTRQTEKVRRESKGDVVPTHYYTFEPTSAFAPPPTP